MHHCRAFDSGRQTLGQYWGHMWNMNGFCRDSAAAPCDLKHFVYELRSTLRIPTHQEVMDNL